METNRKIGNFGEDLASKYLLKNNYKIIDRNVYISHQEIDIIANISGKTVFIEVKTSSDVYECAAEMQLNLKKVKNLKKAIKMYSYFHKLDIDDCQFDLIAVYISKYKKTANIKHYKEVF